MAFRPKAESNLSRSATADRLRPLHQANLDDGRVFREAARVVSDESVAAICDDLSRKRHLYAEELEQYLTEYESEDHESIKTVVHRAWLDLRAASRATTRRRSSQKPFAPTDDFEPRMKRPSPTLLATPSWA